MPLSEKNISELPAGPAPQIRCSCGAVLSESRRYPNSRSNPNFYIIWCDRCDKSWCAEYVDFTKGKGVYALSPSEERMFLMKKLEIARSGLKQAMYRR